MKYIIANIILTVLFVACSTNKILNMSDQLILQEFDKIRFEIDDEVKLKRAELLINSLDDINYQQSGIKENALYKLVITKPKNVQHEKSIYKLVEYQLKKGANPNSNNGTTQIPPIYQAKSEELFDLLVKYKADINHKSDFVHPFDINSTNKRIAKFILLKFDFDVNHGTSNEFRAAFLSNLKPDGFRMLIENDGEKANSYDDLNWTILHYMSSAPRPDLLEIGLEEKLNFKLKTKSENEGYYGYENGIPINSSILEIIELRKQEYVNLIGEERTNELIKRIKIAVDNKR